MTCKIGFFMFDRKRRMKTRRMLFPSVDWKGEYLESTRCSCNLSEKVIISRQTFSGMEANQINVNGIYYCIHYSIAIYVISFNWIMDHLVNNVDEEIRPWREWFFFCSIHFSDSREGQWEKRSIKYSNEKNMTFIKFFFSILFSSEELRIDATHIDLSKRVQISQS